MKRNANYERARNFLYENQGYLNLWAVGKEVLKSVYGVSDREANKIKKEIIDWNQSEYSDVY